MNTNILLIDSILCFAFVLQNFLVNRRKVALLPSTIFGLSWGISTLGCYLYSADIIEGSIAIERHLKNEPSLQQIGEYQFFVLLTIFIAFFIAQRSTHQVTRNNVLKSHFPDDLSYITSKLKFILYLFFFVGMIRFAIVLSAVGFNYNAIRTLYINGRSAFNTFDIQLIRVGSYLMQISVLYVALKGMQYAIEGINIKKVIIMFLLFSPFQMSFGGRLFVLSFFLPFLLSYFLVYFLNDKKYIHRSDRQKIRTILLAGIFLVIILQILKQGETVSLLSMSEYATEVFYNSTSYIYMTEFWNYLSGDFDLQFGRNLITGTCPLVKEMMNYWFATNNSAAVCVPSMIPGMYLDFGYIGSLFVYFFIFFFIEKTAIKRLSVLSFDNMLFFLILCVFCFNTAGSSIFNCFKSLLVSLIIIAIIKKIRRAY